ncbi:MAG: Hsp20/alpha crystallin family protein [Erysipelotrichaceae bacterium]|nr:Hsp20/alpha crystallin family protein [Erysipelotrichaceae bacterium]
MRYNVASANDLFDDLFNNWFDAPVFNGQSVMKTDIHEKDGKYIFEVEIPGYKKEDVKISLYNGNLTVTAQKHESDEEKDARGRMLRQERYSGTMSRTFYVGNHIKDSDVHASFNDGVLKIEIPTEEKKEEESRKFIDIL